MSPMKGSIGTWYWRGRWRPDFENSLNAVWKVDWRGQVLEISTSCKQEEVFASWSRSEEERAGEAMAGTWPQKIAPKWKFHMAHQHVLGDIRKFLSLVTNYRAVLDTHLYHLSFPSTDSQSYKEKESRHCLQAPWTHSFLSGKRYWQKSAQAESHCKASATERPRGHQRL